MECYNKFHVGSDRLTPYERLKDKPYAGMMVPFAEPVLHRVVGKVSGGDMRERWSDGWFLGRSSKADEALVLTSSGNVVRTRAFTPKADGTVIDVQALRRIKDFPGDHVGVISHETTELPERTNDQVIPPTEETELPVPRDIRVTDEAIDDFGYTEGCSKCGQMKRGIIRGTTRHSDSCRIRVKKEMKKDKLWSRRMKEAEERKTGWLAERIGGGTESKVEEETRQGEEEWAKIEERMDAEAHEREEKMRREAEERGGEREEERPITGERPGAEEEDEGEVEGGPAKKARLEALQAAKEPQKYEVCEVFLRTMRHCSSEAAGTTRWMGSRLKSP